MGWSICASCGRISVSWKLDSSCALALQEVDALYFRPTADGDEGGRHQLITASVSNGQLYILKVQVGDKRWFKGVEKDAKGAWNSFTVA